jgi:hypothetical protein
MQTERLGVDARDARKGRAATVSAGVELNVALIEKQHTALGECSGMSPEAKASKHHRIRVRVFGEEPGSRRGVGSLAFL